MTLIFMVRSISIGSQLQLVIYGRRVHLWSGELRAVRNSDAPLGMGSSPGLRRLHLNEEG